MLKISIVDSGRERRLMLEGKLIAPWTTELQRAYDEARRSLLGREIGIDLKNLTVISQEGENLLAALMKEDQGSRLWCIRKRSSPHTAWQSPCAASGPNSVKAS